MKKELGKFGESFAAKYLKNKGFKIINRHWTCRWGEIDLICKKDNILVFVEVKYRKNTSFGNPAEFITYHQRKVLKHPIQIYLLRNKLGNIVWRLDAICLIKVPGRVQIHHFENILY